MTDIELIKNSRAILGLTQEQLAIRINVSRQTVAYWETGRRNPNPDAIRAILEAIVSKHVSTVSRQTFINDSVARMKAKDNANVAQSVEQSTR